MSLGLTLVITTVEFELLEEKGNVLLINVSLRGTDLEVGVLWYGVALWAGGKQISFLCKATSMLKVTFTRFCSLKLAVPLLQRRGPAILVHDNARPHVARICQQFLNRNNVNVLPWPAVSPDMSPIEHIWDYLGKNVRARGNVHNLRGLNRMEKHSERRYQTLHKVIARSPCCLHQWSRWLHSILTTVNIEFPISAE